MPGSRIDGLRPLRIAAFLIALPAAAIAAPLQLTPEQAAAGPVTVAPALNQGAPAAKTRVAPATGGDVFSRVPGPRPVTVERLAVPDPDDAGLTRANSLPPDLWTGSERNAINHLLSDLPVPMVSPGQRALALRLLLSAGTAPIADGPVVEMGADGANTPRRFGALRVQKVAELGDAADARALAERLPGVLGDATTAQALVRSELIAGTFDCKKSAELMKTLDGAFWQRLAVYCAASTGDADGATRGLDLMRERGLSDPALESAVDTLIGLAADTLAPDATADVVTLAALAAAKLAPPADILAKSPAPELALVARNAAAPVEMRVEAAERAATVQFLNAHDLAAIYALMPQREEVIASLQQSAAPEGTAIQRAQVVAAMSAAVDAKRRFDLAILATRLVPPAWRAGPVGGVVASLFDSFSPNPLNGAIAPAAFRFYAAQGQMERATGWYRFLRSDVRTSAEAAIAWPVAAMLDQGADDPTGIDVWLEQVGRPGAKSKALALVPALQALGIAVPGDLGDQLASGSGVIAETSAEQRLDSVYGQGRYGETVLMALSVLGPGGPTASAARTLALTVETLAGIGLERDARAIAREAAVALID